MKVMRIPIFLIVLVFKITTVNAQKLALNKDEYSILLPEGVIKFKIDSFHLIIRYSKSATNNEKDNLRKLLNIQSKKENENNMLVLGFEIQNIGKYFSFDELIKKVSLIQAKTYVDFVAPILSSVNGKKVGLTDIFHVQIKDSNQIQILHYFSKQLHFTISSTQFKNVFSCKISKRTPGNAFEISKYFQRLKIFKFVEPDFLVFTKTSTNDPLYIYQWNLNNSGQYGGIPGADIEIESAWQLTSGSPTIKVAVLDCWGNNAQFSHEDLSIPPSQRVDFTGDGFISTGFPGDAHGISCAGIIGATANNNLGIVGIANNCKIQAVKIGTIYNAQGYFSTSNTILANAIDWARINSDVISNSNDFGNSSSLINIAIERCVTEGRNGKGTLFFSSSGNDNQNSITYPSNNSNAIAVGATSMCDERKSPNSCDQENWGSNYGIGLDIAAPGVQITTTDIAGSAGYIYGDYSGNFSGTSSACPHAAGVMALVLSINPDLTNSNARYVLESSCEKVGGYTYNSNVSGQPNGTWNNEIGYGRINAYKAVLKASTADLTVILPQATPNVIAPGANVALSFAENNLGYVSANPNYVNFHLSSDTILTPGQNGDIYLGQYLVNQSIASLSQTILLSNPITIPVSVDPGIYYIFFAADGTGIVNEYDENNNFATATITVSGQCPDLIIIDQSVTPITLTAGNTITIEFKERNIGNANAGPNYTSFHLSANNILTPGQNGDIYIDEYYVNQTLVPLTQTGTLSKQITIPASVNTGTYYLFFSADGAGTINECDNLNNFATVVLNISGVPSTQAAYKYWFDSNSLNAVTVGGTFGNDYTIQSNIPTPVLQQGLHTFSIGFKDINQKWSSFVSSFFYKLNLNTPAGYSKYEYWFDNLFTTRTIRNISSTSSLILLDSFNTNILSTGLHTINIRFKPDGKHWSSVVSSFFYKPHEIVSPPAQYESWFDNDYSNKVTTNISNSNNIILLDNLSTNNLNAGLHTFNIRFKPDGKQWSSVVSSFFYKIPIPTSGTPKYQYWFDNNSQDSVTVIVGSTNNLILLDSLINAQPVGLHTINMRFKPDGGLWSSVTSSFFYKNPTTTIINNTIARCVYWYDNNWQNPNLVYYSGQQNLYSIINTDTEELSVGMHKVSMMFRDERGSWSSVVSDSFNRTMITSPVCPFNNKLFRTNVFLSNNAIRQWQVDTGTGFVNLVNNANYSGVNSDTLQIINAPTSWYGQQYRCVLTDSSSTLTSQTYILKFFLIWNGTTDSGWENPANWSCGTLPDANTDVIINPGVTNFPEINTAGICRSLTAKPGVNVTVKTGASFIITH